MSISYNPNVITDNLLCYFDAANPKSYPGSGTTLFDLTRNGYNSGFSGNIVYSSAGYLQFDGTGERDGSPRGSYISLNTNATTTSPSLRPNGVTYQWWMKIDQDQAQGHGLFVGSTTINHLEWRGTSTGGNFRTEAVTQNGYSFGASAPPGGLNSSFWHNIAIVFANDETGRPVRWYKNGELFHSGNMTSGTNPGGEYFQPTQFGSSTGSASYLYAQSFYGKASSWIFYDKSLTDDQIRTNFFATRGRYDIQS